MVPTQPVPALACWRQAHGGGMQQAGFRDHAGEQLGDDLRPCSPPLEVSAVLDGAQRIPYPDLRAAWAAYAAPEGVDASGPESRPGDLAAACSTAFQVLNPLFGSQALPSWLPSPEIRTVHLQIHRFSCFGLCSIWNEYGTRMFELKPKNRQCPATHFL